MDPLLMLMAGGNAVKGVSNLVGGGKARRANKKARKEQLALLRQGLTSFNKQANLQDIRLGEAQQGLEGGVANERVRDLNTEQQFARNRLETAIKQAKRSKKAGNRADRLSVLGDVAGITANAASGIDQLFTQPGLPPIEQAGAGVGAGLGAAFGPLGVMQGVRAGQQFARNQALQGLLRRGY